MYNACNSVILGRQRTKLRGILAVGLHLHLMYPLTTSVTRKTGIDDVIGRYGDVDKCVTRDTL